MSSRNKVQPKTRGGPPSRSARKAGAAAYGSVLPSVLPAVGNSRVVTVRHREFVTSFDNAGHLTGFWMQPLSAAVPGWDLNPANEILFPWLSAIASRYERFRFTNLVFHVVSKNSTGDDGRVYAAVDYDYSDDPAANPMELMHQRTSASSNCWLDLTLQCDVAALHRDMPYKFTNIASRVAVEPRTAYCGYLMLGTTTTGNAVSFDLYVEYTVELMTPQFEPRPLTQCTNTFSVLDPDQLVNGPTKWHYTPPLPLIKTDKIRVVTPGTPTVPALEITSGGINLLARYAYDLLATMTGSISTVVDLVLPTYTVAAACALRSYLTYELFDSYGTWLGAQEGLSFEGADRSVDTAAATSTVNPVSVVDTISLAAIRLAFPLVRYVVPLVTGDRLYATLGEYATATSRTEVLLS